MKSEKVPRRNYMVGWSIGEGREKLKEPGAGTVSAALTTTNDAYAVRVCSGVVQASTGCSRALRWRIAFEWIWQTRDSVTLSACPISFMVSSSK